MSSNMDMIRSSALWLLPLSVALLGLACTPKEIGTLPGHGGSSATPSSNGGQASGGTSGANGSGGASGVVYTLPDAGPLPDGLGTTKPPAVWPPPNFINVTDVSFGSYALGPPRSEQPSPGSGQEGVSQCSGLFGVIRDFKLGNVDGGHPDFEKPPMVADLGIVTDTLGDDRKPIYAVDAHPDGTRTTSGQANFDQWYRDTPDVNLSYVIAFRFVKNGSVVTFAASNGNRDAAAAKRDSSYYPLDGQGFGNEGKSHNYAFTTEIHTKFTYSGGETFTFQGDDDVFVYINRHLAIDLGGIHAQQSKSVNLDEQAEALGISKGNVYDLDVFNAERHTTQSNFRIDTTMVFEDCGSIIP
jgi:fibro-slime domain-containing protein